MKSKRLFAVVGAVILCLAAWLSAADAWEINLSGNWNWTYEYYNQQEGMVFGPYDVDADNLPAYNSNFWYGIPRIIARNVASGCDAVAQYTYLELYPEITVNKAVRLRGQYRVGGWNDALGSAFVQKINSYYLTGTAVGTEVAMAEGHWTQFWASIHSPWGRVVFGKRPKAYGLGLQYDGARTLTTESLLIRTDYGPLTLGIGLYPYRQSLFARELAFDDLLVYGSLINKMDKNVTPEIDLEGFVLYRSGPMEVGVFSAYCSYRQGAEALPPNFVGPDLSRFSQEGSLFQGTSFVKFNNGRFFFNAEAAWVYGTKRQKANFIPEEIDLQSTQARTYVEQWRYMIETGVMAGPAKLSFLYGFTPGIDRRNGILIDRQPSTILRHQLLTRELASVSVWRPYAYVMSYMFNSGLPNAFDLTNANALFSISALGALSPRVDSVNREGAMLDAQVLAARLDYAVAANLNAYATFVKANRASDGYGWGCIFPYPYYYYLSGYSLDGEVFVAPNVNRLSPTIPDKDLGYEVDAGVDWKLLEGWTFGLLVGRWQPGKWFSYACVDKSVPGWSAFGLNNFANNYGTRPNKLIDAVWATTVSLSVDFRF